MTLHPPRLNMSIAGLTLDCCEGLGLRGGRRQELPSCHSPELGWHRDVCVLLSSVSSCHAMLSKCHIVYKQVENWHGGSCYYGHCHGRQKQGELSCLWSGPWGPWGGELCQREDFWQELLVTPHLHSHIYSSPFSPFSRASVQAVSKLLSNTAVMGTNGKSY